MRQICAAALLALALAGCAHQRPVGRSPIDPTRPQIYVTSENNLVVDQEPVIVPRSSADRKVTWQLQRDSKARFDKKMANGITVDALDKLLQPDGKPVNDKAKSSKVITDANIELRKRAAGRASLFDCRFENDLEFSCIVPRDLPLGLYAYTIRVMIDGNQFELDPRIMP
jgi:hypothetical protein